MDTYIDQAYEYYENKQLQLAKQTIIKEQLFFTNPIALNLIGSICWKLNNIKEAKKYYLLAVKCRKDFWPAYLNLGNLFYEDKKYSKALKYYIAALSHKGENFIIYFNIGTCLLKMKRPTKAISYLLKSLELKPTHLETNINLAKAFYENNNFKKSFIYFNTALAIDGDNNIAKIGYKKSWKT